MRADISVNLIAEVFIDNSDMCQPRLNLLRYLILLFAFWANASFASSDNPLPDELRWSPIEMTGAIVDVAVVDSIIPMAPQFSRWGTSLYPDSIPAQEDTNRNWWYLFKQVRLSMSDPTGKWP